MSSPTDVAHSDRFQWRLSVEEKSEKTRMCWKIAVVPHGKKAWMATVGVDLSDIGGAEPGNRSTCLSKTDVVV